MVYLLGGYHGLSPRGLSLSISEGATMVYLLAAVMVYLLGGNHGLSPRGLSWSIS